MSYLITGAYSMDSFDLEKSVDFFGYSTLQKLSHVETLDVTVKENWFPSVRTTLY